MREYGKVYTAFWADPSVRSLSEDGRTLFLYLLTCPHGNSIGLFRLPDAYAADDLQWTAERVSKGFQNLVEHKLCSRETVSAWVVLPKYVRWNGFENPNVATGAQKAFDAAPDCEPKVLCAKALLEYGAHLSAEFRNRLETVAKRSRNPEPKPEPEPEPEPEKDIAPTALVISPQAKRPAVPVKEIIDLYHEVLPMCPQVRKLTDARRKQIEARWRSGDLPDLETWRDFFAYCAESKFLTGQAQPMNGHKHFTADLEWLSREGNYAKIFEGKYHR